MTETALFITHRVLPGRRDDVRAVWHRWMAPAITDNPGHVGYTYCLDPADPDVVCAFQVYRSAADAAAFLTTDAYRSYEREVAPLLAGPPEVRPLTPDWSLTRRAD